MAVPPSYASRVQIRPLQLPNVNPDAYGAPIAEGLQAIGKAAYGAQIDTLETNQHIDQLNHAAAMLEDKRALESGMADAGARYATSLAQLNQSVVDLRANAQPGAAGHEAQVAEAVKKWQDDFMGTLGDQRLVNAFLPDVAKAAGTIGTEEKIWTIGQRANKQASDFDTFVTTSANGLTTKPSAQAFDDAMAVGEKMIGAMSASDDMKAKLRKSLTHDLTMGAFNGQVGQDPRAALQAIDGGTFDAVFDDKERVQLRAHVQAVIEHQEAQARAKKNAELEEIRQGARVQIEQVTEGVAVDGSPLLVKAEVVEALGDPGLAHDLRIAAMKTQVNARYSGASPAEMQDAKRQIEGRKDWRADEKLVAAHSQLEVLIGRTTDRAQSDKLGLWVENGGNLNQLDITDPNSIRTRIAQGRAAQQRYGGPLQLLTEDQAAPMRDEFGKANAGGQAATIAAFAPFGNEATKAILRQIAPLKPEYAALGDLATMRNTLAGGQSMREALTGWEQIAANGKIVDDKRMQAEVDGQFGPAIALLDGQTRQGVMKVAQGIYANRVAGKGGAPVFDRQLWLDSYQRALGAAGDGTGGVQRTKGGAPLVAPRGMSAADVENILALANGQDIMAAGGHDAPTWGGKTMTPSQFKQLIPVTVSDGRLAFQSRGGGYVKSQSNPSQNFVLDIRGLATILRSRDKQQAAPAGLVEAGNINLHRRPVAHNADGSISTVRSISITNDRGAVLIPTVVDGKVVSNREAIDHYHRTGEHLGIFDTEAHATTYARLLHEQQATEYRGR